jgi:lipopolysaccharide export system permease protein
MNRVDRYISASFLTGCAPVLFLLLTLFSFLGLSEELEDVGDGSYQLADALLVVLYTLPALAVDLLPVTALLGGLLGLGALANNLELVSLRAAAISPARIARPVAQLALALVIVVLLVQSFVIPQAAYSVVQLRSKTLLNPVSIAEEETRGFGVDEEFWTMNDGQFVRIGFLLPNRNLADVEIYQYDRQGELELMLQAPRAQLLQGSSWLLHQVHSTRPGDASANQQFRDTMAWDSLLNVEQARALTVPASSLSPTDLWKSVGRLERNNMNPDRHRILFWKQMSIPLSLIGMALLSLPFLLGSTRSVPVGQRMALGGVIGISFYLVQQISGHLAGILQWNAALTVLAPGLLVLGVALTLLWRAR